MGRKPNPENCCEDCGTYALGDIKNYYMVTNDLWKEFGNGRGVLCLNCLRKRIQRKFTRDDFPDLPVNKYNDYITDMD